MYKCDVFNWPINVCFRVLILPIVQRKISIYLNWWPNTIQVRDSLLSYVNCFLTGNFSRIMNVYCMILRRLERFIATSLNIVTVARSFINVTFHLVKLNQTTVLFICNGWVNTCFSNGHSQLNHQMYGNVQPS